jgi:hypothetical protein
MGYLFKVIRSGIHKPAGVVDIPYLGAKVGELTNWTLTRRGDTGQDAALYDLHASFSFISMALWEDPDFEKRIIVNLSPYKQYRLEQVSGMATVLQDKSLLMEGVTIHPVPKEKR